jgi:hypothetical protein
MSASNAGHPISAIIKKVFYWPPTRKPYGAPFISMTLYIPMSGAGQAQRKKSSGFFGRRKTESEMTKQMELQFRFLSPMRKSSEDILSEVAEQERNDPHHSGPALRSVILF